MLACGPIYRRSKPKLLYMHEDTCHLPSMQSTKCPLQCMHHTKCPFHTPQHVSLIYYNMCYSYTTPCVHHAPCYLSSHATFHFVECMLDMWQWLSPTTLMIPSNGENFIKTSLLKFCRYTSIIDKSYYFQYFFYYSNSDK